MKNIIYFVVLLAFLAGCKSQENEVSLNAMTYEVIDSIPLFNDSLAMRFVNPEKINENKILAWQHPLLNLSVFDSSGVFQQEITKRGDYPGSVNGQFIEPVWGQQNNIFLIDQGFGGWMYFFDSSFKYIRKINLLEEFPEYSISPISSHTDLLYSSKDTLVFLSSVGNRQSGPDESAFYKSHHNFVKFTIVGQKLLSAVPIIPLIDFESVTEALDEEKIYWDYTNAIFDISNDALYAMFHFDDYVYHYSVDDFSMPLEKIKINRKYKPVKKFENKLDSPKKLSRNERVENDYKFRYINGQYRTIKYDDGKLLIIYRKPIPETRVPATGDEEFNNQYLSILHVYDLNSGQQYSLDLPLFLTDYPQVYPIGNDTFLVVGDEKLSEDIYLYKIRLIYED